MLFATRPSLSGFSAQKDGQGAIQLCWPPPDRPFQVFNAIGRSRGDPTTLAATRPSLSGFSAQKDGQGAIQLRWPPPDRPFQVFQRKRTVKGRSSYAGRHQTVPFRFFSAKGRSRGYPTMLFATRPSLSGFSVQKDGPGAIQLRCSPPDRPDVISTRSPRAGS